MQEAKIPGEKKLEENQRCWRKCSEWYQPTARVEKNGGPKDLKN